MGVVMKAGLERPPQPGWQKLPGVELKSEQPTIEIRLPKGFQRYRLVMDLVSVSHKDCNLDIRFGNSTVTRMQKDRGVHDAPGRDFVLMLEPIPGSYPDVRVVNNDPSYPPVYGMALSGDARTADWDTALTRVVLYATGTSFDKNSRVTVMGYK